MTRTPYEECLPEIEKEVIVESYSELGMDEPNIKLFKKGQ